jgi:hypothetical protein
MKIDRAKLSRWKSGKKPAFLIASPEGETITFDSEEAIDLYEELASSQEWVTLYATTYNTNDPAHITPNGRGLNEYLKHTVIRSIRPMLTEAI